MNREFLKEAIADAKTMKESAIANAKVALEEAFTPQLQAMFATKIEEMDNMDEEAENKMKEANEEVKEEKDTSEEDMDLNEILAELEKDLEKSNTTKLSLKEDDSDEESEEEGYLDGEEDEAKDVESEDDEEIDLEEMSEDDLKSFIEDVIADMVKAGELEAGEEMEVEDEDEVEVEDDMDIETEDELEVTIDEDQGYNDKLDDAEGAKHGKKKQDMAQRRADSENMEKAKGKRKYAGDSQMDKEVVDEDLREDLKQAMDTVVALKSELNEINLLNAKLLYANKIFKTNNMNESQKARVLGAFDKATTVKEAKIVYTTISENYTFKNIKKVNESKLGSASKSISAPRVTKKKPIMESDEMVNRFKKLAGII